MRRVRKHIDHAGCEQFKSVLVHQYPQISRQRPRVAGHIEQAPRSKPRDRGQQLARTDPGWIEQQDFARPAWLGEEVTDDQRYYNFRLSQHPYREWP